MYYATQTDVTPPTIVLFVNNPNYLNETYQRYMINRFRELLPFARGADPPDDPGRRRGPAGRRLRSTRAAAARRRRRDHEPRRRGRRAGKAGKARPKRTEVQTPSQARLKTRPRPRHAAAPLTLAGVGQTSDFLTAGARRGYNAGSWVGTRQTILVVYLGRTCADAPPVAPRVRPVDGGEVLPLEEHVAALLRRHCRGLVEPFGPAAVG